MVDDILMTSRNGTVKSLADGNIGRLLSKPPIRQNNFPAKISSHTVIDVCIYVCVYVCMYCVCVCACVRAVPPLCVHIL